jgi:hypothetical protein
MKEIPDSERPAGYFERLPTLEDLPPEEQREVLIDTDFQILNSTVERLMEEGQYLRLYNWWNHEIEPNLPKKMRVA